MKKIKVGVIGATGYTGSEVVRILSQHPNAEIVLITSETRAGEAFSDIHPFFRGIVDDVLHTADKIDDTDLDLVFLALPHGISMKYAERFARRRFRIVDFSGDFRLGSPEVYEQWYAKKHTWPEGFQEAVYGLPELFADEISKARIVANPGCFPTGAILSLAPLIAAGYGQEAGLVIDSKTGVTGAGIKPSAVNMFSNVNDNFKAYGLKKHRHTIEIQEILEKITVRDGLRLAPVQFTPHLLPVDRGILTTAYIRVQSTQAALPVQSTKSSQSTQPAQSAQADQSAQPAQSAQAYQAASRGIPASSKQEAPQENFPEMYRRFYEQHPFVRICDKPPSLKDVRASNYIDIFVDYDERTGNVIVISAIDNLVKGAAGLAVQNMNVMFGLDETAGLGHIPIQP